MKTHYEDKIVPWSSLDKTHAIMEEIKSHVISDSEPKPSKSFTILEEDDEAVMLQCFTYEHYRVGLHFNKSLR